MATGLVPVMGAGESAVISPVMILVLCVVAGIGTVFLLPSRREATIRKIGGVIVLAAALIFFALLVRYTAGLQTAAGAPAGGMSVYFWVFSAIALIGSIRVVTHPRPVYSALYFVLTVFASAGLFVLLWAEFMAAALVLIYAGAILVTYVFVIMLAAQATASAPGTSGAKQVMGNYDTISREPFVASAIGFALMGVLLFVIFDKAPAKPMDLSAKSESAIGNRQSAITESAIRNRQSAIPSALSPQPSALTTPGSAQSIGEYLFRNQVLNLELAGLILTIGMVGAILIARRRVVGAPTPVPQVGAAPGFEVDDNPHTIPVYGTENPHAKAYPEE